MKKTNLLISILFVIFMGIMSPISQSSLIHAVSNTSNKISIPLDQGEDVVVEVDGEVLSIHQSPRYVVVSGTFSTVKVDAGTSVQVQNVAIVDLQNRVLMDWVPAFNGAIFDIESYQNQIFIAGNFTQVGTTSQPSLAVFDSSLKQLSPRQYAVDGAVNSLEVYESTLILGGEFEHIDAVERMHLGGISLEKQLITSWNPSANASVNSIARDVNTLYVGGAFTTIAGQARTYLASFYLPSGILSEWAPVVASPVQKLSLNEGALIVELASSDPAIGIVQATVPVDTSIGQTDNSDISIASVQTQDEKNSDLMVDEGALGFKIPTLTGMLTFAIRIFFVIAGLLALFYMLMGALAWVTSGGDKDSVAAARDKIQAAVIGLLMMVVVLGVVWTMEQVIFKRRICLGLTCPLTLPSIIKTNDEI